jgi:Vacuolar protein sorting-associated protein 26
METLAKFEIMDGAPVRGENIPIRSVDICVLCTNYLLAAVSASHIAEQHLSEMHFLSTYV